MSSAALSGGFHAGPYPERHEEKRGRLDEWAARLAGRLPLQQVAHRKRTRRLIADVADRESRLRDLSKGGIGEEVSRLRRDLQRDGYRDAHVAGAFALVREVARRELGMRPHDVQLEGGFAMLSGMVAEMDTGEGKTLTATLPAAVAGLAGIPVHVITVNDYLVARDAELMGPVYAALGLSVGAIQQGMSPDERRARYASDITYCSNKELAFDYLKDRIALGSVRSRLRLDLEHLARGGSRADQLVLRGLWFGIVDEADSVLVDEARTPLIISGGAEASELEEEVYETAVELARALEAGVHFITDERTRGVRLLPAGEDRLAELARGRRGIWRGPRRRTELVSQALSALHLFHRDRHYLVADGKVQIIDEYTGRLMPDRSWEQGLHQMIEAKEDCELSGQTDPLAKISYQRFFRRYLHLAGMTGTAREVTGEFWSVYRLPVAAISTHRPRQRKSLGLQVHETADQKWQAVVASVLRMRDQGRAVLVGTRSVGASEHLSSLLTEKCVPHRVLNARQNAEEAEIVAEAGHSRRVTVATNMAGRGTDITLAPEVREAGGLHVIATERHEARRIDRQLFGRCGRQGDPGTYEEIVSLEDQLVADHAGPMALAARAQGGGTGARVRKATVVLAQQRAERLHARIRRATLKTDDQVASRLAFSGRSE